MPPSSDIEVVDSQVHIWEPESADRPWPPGGAAWASSTHRGWLSGPDEPSRPLQAAELGDLMDAAGVSAAVLVPPWFQGYDNSYVISAAAAAPSRYRVMARIDPAAPAIDAELTRLASVAEVAGVRVLFHRETRDALTDGTAEKLWHSASGLGMPVMVYAPGQVEHLRDVASQYPDVRIAIDHLGLSGGGTREQRQAEIDCLLRLSDLPNVAVKASAAPCYSTDPYPYRDLHAEVLAVLGAFGAERVFWGSDVSRLRGGYREAVTMFTEHLGLSVHDRRQVMGAGLRAWLGWELGSDMSREKEGRSS
nr:amidohydrolase family protein [Sinosporangium album]